MMQRDPLVHNILCFYDSRSNLNENFLRNIAYVLQLVTEVPKKSFECICHKFMKLVCFN